MEFLPKLKEADVYKLALFLSNRKPTEVKNFGYKLGKKEMVLEIQSLVNKEIVSDVFILDDDKAYKLNSKKNIEEFPLWMADRFDTDYAMHHLLKNRFL